MCPFLFFKDLGRSDPEELGRSDPEELGRSDPEEFFAGVGVGEDVFG